MVYRDSLPELKRRVKKSVWAVDWFDLPMMAKWLLELEEGAKDEGRDWCSFSWNK